MENGQDGPTGQTAMQISALTVIIQETEPVQNLLHNWVVQTALVNQLITNLVTMTAVQVRTFMFEHYLK